ncbi:Crp/Fnr family transcriptional regulator [Solimicrobium silvestre]|uniref:Crp-like helix-turn-helix domain n=1 Tax=Solimicrobium silvestre TaxID=2099400 RepID=A0A2S9GXB8_9BURK|nr:Crp/Fnr family transcriptional regulator [Solimicrobium silvestre]PRC92306.1 Crp-like helix-turn-helix domain [Solimicrobium silvestre]
MNNSSSKTISTNARLAFQSTALLTKTYSSAAGKFTPSPIGATQNDLLASLHPDELAYLLPHLELVKLPLNKELHQHGSEISHVYFPTTAIIASLFLRADGNETEIGVTGHEGLIGTSILMSDRALGTARVQSAGFAYKMDAAILKEVCMHCSKLHDLLMRYMQASFSKMTLISVYENHCTVDQKLARWLLDRLDRSATNVLNVTQEMIATMLCVRRESITEAACRLRNAGLISYLRGIIVVLDRDGLEINAGESYTMAKQEFDLILSDPNSNLRGHMYAT